MAIALGGDLLERQAERLRGADDGDAGMAGFADSMIELQQRLALPLANLLFAFLALPLGITRARTHLATSCSRTHALAMVVLEALEA